MGEFHSLQHEPPEWFILVCLILMIAVSALCLFGAYHVVRLFI